MENKKIVIEAQNVDDFVEYLWLNKNNYKSIIKDAVEINLLAFKSAGLKINTFADNHEEIESINKEISQKETCLLNTIKETFDIKFDIEKDFFNNFIKSITAKAIM